MQSRKAYGTSTATYPGVCNIVGTVVESIEKGEERANGKDVGVLGEHHLVSGRQGYREREVGVGGGTKGGLGGVMTEETYMRWEVGNGPLKKCALVRGERGYVARSNYSVISDEVPSTEGI